MGTIKDIVDLTTQLINNVKFRKFSTEISQIQSLISTLQSEQMETANKISNISKENMKLESENFNLKSELKNKNSEFIKKISILKDKHTKEISKIKKNVNIKIPDTPKYNFGQYE